MSEPFLGEIRLFGGNFAPVHWALCNGQLLAIQQNSALFALLGTTYGGNGVTTFALPDLRGRVPVGEGIGGGLTPRIIGEASGVETVTLTTANMPLHAHSFYASTATANQNLPTNNLPGDLSSQAAGHFYVSNTGTPAPTFGNLNAQSLSTAGGGVPHDNLMPSQCVSFIISLQGIFPSRQ
jgi:microcystin-dependent protein